MNIKKNWRKYLVITITGLPVIAGLDYLAITQVWIPIFRTLVG